MATSVIKLNNAVIKAAYANISSRALLESHILNVCSGLDDYGVATGSIYPNFTDLTIGINGSPGTAIYMRRTSGVYVCALLLGSSVCLDYYYSNAHHWNELALNSKIKTIENGVDNVSSSGSTIQFTGTHSSAPNVVATGADASGNPRFPVITGRTSTGFSVKVLDASGSSVNGYINWLAIW